MLLLIRELSNHQSTLLLFQLIVQVLPLKPIITILKVAHLDYKKE